jgi:hypothetical protein
MRRNPNLIMEQERGTARPISYFFFFFNRGTSTHPVFFFINENAPCPLCPQTGQGSPVPNADTWDCQHREETDNKENENSINNEERTTRTRRKDSRNAESLLIIKRGM